MQVLELLIKMPGFLAVAGTLCGAFITGLITYGINRTNKISEEKRHLREVIVNTAIENWKQDYDAAIKEGKSITLAPLESYIIHMTKLSDILFDSDKITSKKLISKLKEVDSIIKAHKEYDKSK